MARVKKDRKAPIIRIRTGEKVPKTEAVREGFSVLGIAASERSVNQWLRQEFGAEVGATLIYTTRARIQSGEFAPVQVETSPSSIPSSNGRIEEAIELVALSAVTDAVSLVRRLGLEKTVRLVTSVGQAAPA